MKKIYLLLLVGIFFSKAFAQIPVSSNVYFAKEFSKEISLFKAKKYLITEILKLSAEPVEFEAIPLAASTSGDITTLLYRSSEQNKEGLILGFYGDYWNDAGVIYQGYGFKNLNSDKAAEFLNKIESEIQNHKKFLRDNNDNNNISFQYDDLTVVIWTTISSYNIRVFWKSFDATWEATSYERSKRRFERKSGKL